MPRPAPRLGASDWLGLAASPTFAGMGLIAASSEAVGHGAAPLAGMALMYLLMATFHAAPWLRLMSRPGSGAALGDQAAAGPPGSTASRTPPAAVAGRPG